MARAPSAAALKKKMAVNVRILGAKASAENIRRMDKAARKRFFEELVKLAGEILAHSKEKYVPVLTGALKRSGTLAAHQGRYPSVEIGFGGSAVDYALIQHENLQFEHPRGGSAKYLELAVKDYEPRIQHLLEEPLRAELRKYPMHKVKL